MITDFKEVLKNRRTNYALTNKSLVSDAQIEEVLDFALLNTPSAFNSQTSRMVLLLGENHLKLWNIVLETLRKMVKPEDFSATEDKIKGSFMSGYGTILFFEDQSIIHGLQEKFPSYKEAFPNWSNHSAGMHQLVVWSLIESLGFGASLQHYNPLIDEAVAKEWNLPKEWKLLAEMPFGVPSQLPGEKVMQPLDNRKKVFK